MESVANAIAAYSDKDFYQEGALKKISIFSNYTGEKLIEIKVHIALHFKGAVLTQTFYNNNGHKVRQDLEFPHCYYIDSNEMKGDG